MEYVWTWLPDRTEPVVAGRLAPMPEGPRFNYGRSYLARADRVTLHLPELPLQAGVLPLLTGLSIPGRLRDAAPDGSGRRVIINQLLGGVGVDADTAVLDELSYLLHSGSEWIGALEFQPSLSHYLARQGGGASLDELLECAWRVEQGLPRSAALARPSGTAPKLAARGRRQRWTETGASGSPNSPAAPT